MDFYQRKLYALLRSPESPEWGNNIVSQLSCLQNNINELESWWQQGKQAREIAASSDHFNLKSIDNQENSEGIRACHPISGQKQNILLKVENQPNIDFIKNEPEAKKVFWWFWRFYPEFFANQQQDALLSPAHMVLPDCPLHSHQSAVSALTGAMFPRGWKDGNKPKTPYLLLFSFSPVQEFIKSSRKFVDFWAGSYLLHYLSSKLCWYIADKLGPDALIVPSLWNQEIIDALIIKKYSDFETDFEKLPNGNNPVKRFDNKLSTSLSTAGFPNTITVLVSGKENARRWGNYLSAKLKKEWVEIGKKVRKDIREKVTNFLQENNEEELKSIVTEVFSELEQNSPEFELYFKELTDLADEKKHGCWEWGKLWEVQLQNTWEPYWTAIPLGNPETSLAIKRNDNNYFDENWLKNQDNIAQPVVENFPDQFETDFYQYFNVGTWWGSIQQRLGLCLNNVKYTRNWEIPTAPGERSTISGKFSAVHPRFNWHKFREGRGQASGSMRLFWNVMKLAYPGLFNGSEKLNALEITKRMAWVYGGVAEDLGIDINSIIKKIKSLPPEEEKEFQLVEENQIIYEQLIRFPNSSSIASARFIHDDNHDITSQYRQLLSDKIKNKFSNRYRKFFDSITRRASHVLKTDKKINPNNNQINNQNNNSNGYYNGVMFSSKWLADDMGLKTDDAAKLKELVNEAHKDKTIGFGEGSPADWWVILLADGDGMGDYVSGKKLEKYSFYVEVDAVDRTGEQFNHSQFENFIKNTDKRMGPATHIGLNRALLDFSNRLVPYLTEQRFCGRVVYSGGDDVMVMLPIEDLPEYLLSLRSAWCGGDDPYQEFENNHNNTSNLPTGYWYPKQGVGNLKDLPQRPHFTMGKNATMSAGIVFAHKSVPLPTVLESLWDAESGRAKKITGKDGLCFRVIYGGGNQLEALMKGELLAEWWDWVKDYQDYQDKLAPLLYRLAEELPRRASITENHYLFSKAAKVIMDNRDSEKQLHEVFIKIEKWLASWENWVKGVIEKWAEDNLKDSKNLSFEQKIQIIQDSKSKPVGIEPEDLGKILRFTAFWIDKRVERWKWRELSEKSKAKS
ncbi:MAG: type III-B CRISPR-associated protein Cas10/Cmr2 [Rivularia sp. (in: Bacteria)]|nr:type III-B CRISPR-associated protein Cas10/Cmr2 [Rivularia sp. MS3]